MEFCNLYTNTEKSYKLGHENHCVKLLQSYRTAPAARQSLSSGTPAQLCLCSSTDPCSAVLVRTGEKRGFSVWGRYSTLQYPKMGLLTAQRILGYFVLENSCSEYFSLCRKLIGDHATKHYALKVADFGLYHSKVNLLVNSRLTQLQLIK